jgi:hypothetical protein
MSYLHSIWYREKRPAAQRTNRNNAEQPLSTTHQKRLQTEAPLHSNVIFIFPPGLRVCSVVSRNYT